jgi:hypothetical protein
MSIEDRLDRIETILTALLNGEQVREWYSVAEFAQAVGKAEFTCREYCRNGRINAKKKSGGRGDRPEWAISHDELLRFRREGLLPITRRPN